VPLSFHNAIFEVALLRIIFEGGTATMAITKIDVSADTKNGIFVSSLPDKYRQEEFNIYANFTLKHMSIIKRASYLNERLDLHYETWKFVRYQEPKSDSSSPINSYRSVIDYKNWEHKYYCGYFEQEEIAMHLRKMIDDSICLLSIATKVYFRTRKGLLRPFESIGEFIGQIDKFEGFGVFKSYLQEINELSNGFKHCPANTISTKIGLNEPCIYVYENDKNGETYCYKEGGVSISHLTEEYNKFYSKVNEIIKAE